MNDLWKIKHENKDNKEDCLFEVYLTTGFCIRSLRAPLHLNGKAEKLIKICNYWQCKRIKRRGIHFIEKFGRTKVEESEKSGYQLVDKK